MVLKKMVKVIVFGLDGGTWNLLRPWIKNGDLKTFQKLTTEGTRGSLESTYPPISVPAWPAMLMSKKPEKLNAYEFMRRANNSYKTTLNNIKFDGAIWQILNNYNRRSYIINIPFTRLPKKKDINGIFITGPILNFGEITNDKEVRKLIKEFRYLIDIPHYNNKYKIRFIKEIIDRSKNQLKLVKNLLSHDWELLFYVNYYTDIISHYYWKYLDKEHPCFIKNVEIVNLIKDFYKILDEFIASLIERGDYIFIVSDHGFGPLYYEVNLNKWLFQERFLKYRSPSTLGKLKEKYREILLRVKSNSYLRPFIKSIFHFLIPYSQKLRFMTERNLDYIDWQDTKAYSLQSRGITINLQKREPLGCVHQKDFKRRRKEIINRILTLRDPEGRYVIEKAWQVEEFYQNPPPQTFPDIILQYKNYHYVDRPNFHERNKLFERTNFSGNHEREGIFIAYGKDIRQGHEIKDAKIYDLLPTILHILSIPIPIDVDGKVLLDAFDEKSELKKREIIQAPIENYEKIMIKTVIQEKFKRNPNI